MNRRQTWRLSLSYLGVIMAMSLLFSVVIFFITAAQLERPLPMSRQDQPVVDIPGETQRRLTERDQQIRTSTIVSLVGLNLGVLMVGSLASYFLARRTLAPIKAAMAQQRRFVSDASHELRTPLTALQTVNEVALRKKVLTEEKARAVLSQNITEITKLRELTEALLGLVKADRSAVKAVRVRELLGQVVQTAEPIAAKKQITIQLDASDITAVVNEAALSQVVGIFLDNAIKYSPPQSQVVVSAAQTKHLEVTVRDHGPGIAKADQAKIFDRFYRADAARTRSQTSGYGLGLAIAKQIADDHHYQLSVTSKPGAGAAFRVVV